MKEYQECNNINDDVLEVLRRPVHKHPLHQTQKRKMAQSTCCKQP